MYYNNIHNRLILEKCSKYKKGINEIINEMIWDGYKSTKKVKENRFCIRYKQKNVEYEEKQ